MNEELTDEEIELKERDIHPRPEEVADVLTPN